MPNNGQHTEGTLNDRTTQVVGEDMLELVEQVRVATEEYLKAKAEVEYLNDMRKVILFDIIEALRADYEQDNIQVTEKQLETEARTHSRYRKLLNTRKHETKKLAATEAKYYAMRNRLDVIQAQLAYAKSEHYFLQNSE